MINLNEMKNTCVYVHLLLSNLIEYGLVYLTSKAPGVSLSKKLNIHCLVLFGSRDRFECDFTIKLKYI